MGDGGKGSTQRPITNWKTFEENWNEIFGVGGRVEPKLPNRGSDAVRGVGLGQERGDCGGEQHGGKDGAENGPSK